MIKSVSLADAEFRFVPCLKSNYNLLYGICCLLRQIIALRSMTQSAVLRQQGGKQLKQITLTQRGEGSTLVSGSQFSPGMYLYALIADGQEVDVKRMILTE